MVKTITPFSTRAKEGATDSPLGDFVNVEQSIVSTADVGFYDQNTGKLTGVLASDKHFIFYTDESIANGGTILTPSVNADGTWPLDMTGFSSVYIAIKPTNGGNCAITAVMGPDSNSFGGLSPVNAASNLKGSNVSATGNAFSDLFNDSAESLTANVWNIFIIGGNSTTGELANQKLLQFKIVNNSGDISTIDTAFLRIV
jgi:hypothetical protein